MTAEQWIINRMQELDEWRWNGLIGEADYQERTAYWRHVLTKIEQGEE